MNKTKKPKGPEYEGCESKTLIQRQENAVEAIQAAKPSLLATSLRESYCCGCIVGVAFSALLSPVVGLDQTCAKLNSILYKHINEAKKLHKVGL